MAELLQIEGPDTGVDRLDSIKIADFLEKSVRHPDGSPTFDLRSITWITPAALVQITAVLHTLSSVGNRATVLLQGSPIRSYLDRVGFTSIAEPVATLIPERTSLMPLPYSNRHGSNPLLIELTKIDSGAALPELLDRIVLVLRRRLRYKKHDAFDIAMVMSEVSQNAFDHNVSTCGFLAMQVYGKGTKRRLEIGISDHGVGLRETLRRNPANAGISNDFNAIQAATTLGTSEHDDPTRGTGLYHLLEITYKHGGTVQIWSGNTKIRYRMDKRQGWSFPVPVVSGVHVALILPTKAA